MAKKSVYANALLYQGEILFYRTAQRKYDKYDFYKDFMRAGLTNLQTGKMEEFEVERIEFVIDEKNNNFIFNDLAPIFYKSFNQSEHLTKMLGSQKNSLNRWYGHYG